MAFNNGFPINYPQYYPQYFQQPQQPQQAPQSIQQTQIQDGGFLVVPSEDIARSYPVAPGKCLTFKIEGKPIVIEKSMGFSQLEAPKIDRYRLIKEEPEEETGEKPAEVSKKCSCSTDVESLKGEINKLWKEIRRLEHEQPISHVSTNETESNAVIESEV